MQKRLAQIAQIPLIIQSTLDSVTKTFDEFLSPIDDADPESNITTSADVEQTVDEKDTPENDRSEMNATDEIIMEDHDDLMFENVAVSEVIEDNARLIEFTPEPTPEPELTEGQILRLEKQIKVSTIDLLISSV